MYSPYKTAEDENTKWFYKYLARFLGSSLSAGKVPPTHLSFSGQKHGAQPLRLLKRLLSDTAEAEHQADRTASLN